MSSEIRMPHKRVRMYRAYSPADLATPEATARRKAEWKREDEASHQKMCATIASLKARGVELEVDEPFGEALITVRIDGVEVGQIW